MLEKTAIIFGDSIMKGTVYEGGRYRSCYTEVFLPQMEGLDIALDNRSRFGYTAERGLGLIKKAIAAGEKPDYALVEYGGNDCNFDWPAIGRDPDYPHQPVTALADFEATMRECIGLLRGAGITPVLMSLPPVDSDKYYEYIISKGVDRCSLLKFLGTPLSIYRYQELYSVAISKLARSEELPFVDVRSAFLECIGSPFSQLISGDGLHPTEKGYEIVARCFRERLESIPGLVANAQKLPAGCKFHPRCSHCTAKCGVEIPHMRQINADHFVACWDMEA